MVIIDYNYYYHCNHCLSLAVIGMSSVYPGLNKEFPLKIIFDYLVNVVDNNIKIKLN